MIFDGRTAKEVYTRFYDGEACLEQLLGYCRPLVEAIATDLSTSDRYREDLIQEGYIKLLKLFNSRKFKPNGKISGGDFHSWLSYSLKNCMIDWLRKQRSYQELPDDIMIEHQPDFNDPKDVIMWALKRFPELPDELLYDAALYIQDALREDVVRKSIGIITTLQVAYSLDVRTSKLMYNSIRIYLQAGPDYIDHALALASEDTYANTLLPELVLLTGKETAINIILTFKSCRLQF